MLIEKIKTILGEELTALVTEKLGTVELGITNDGSLVPADKHESMKTEFKATQEQLESLQSQIKDLEGSTGTIEELKEQLKSKGEEFEKFKNDTSKREMTRNKETALAKLLDKAGFIPSSIDLLIPTIDKEKITLDSKGNIVDADELINPIKEARKELIIEKKLDDNPPPNSNPPDDDPKDAQAYFNKAMKKEK